MPGYSGKLLATKLGLKSGQRLLLLNSPPEFPAALGPVPDGISIISAATPEAADVMLLFGREAHVLRKSLSPVVAVLPRGGMLWIAWPKKAAKQVTDVTEAVVRSLGLATGLVDVKVCAITDIWSGLKFVHRRVST